MKKVPVNRIIPFSNVDGPGNRTAVFFQGCSFDCMFCHNPETIHLCSGCGVCVDQCPAGALTKEESGRIAWNRERCVQCDRCLHVCPSDASPRVRWMDEEELAGEVRRSIPYIDGITVSGGECTLYAEFLIRFFRRIREKEDPAGRLTFLLDSNGSLDFEGNPDILDVCDGVMLDVKAAEAEWSRQLVGDEGAMVRKNLEFLRKRKKLQEVRTVLFPGRQKENEETVRYVAERIGDACDYRIIRYRPFGVRERYQTVLGHEETDRDYAEQFVELARNLGASRAYLV